MQITSLSPASGVIGTQVTITGAGFGAEQKSSFVTINNISVVASLWSDTRIIVSVPSGARTGPVEVTVDGIASAGVGFTVMPDRVTGNGA